MVVVLSIKRFHMQSEGRLSDEGLKKFADQFGVEVADLGGIKSRPPDETWPPGNIERHPRQRFIHHQMDVGEADDTALIAERRRDGLAQSNANIFYAMVMIHLQIAFCGDFEIDERMPRQLLEHVIEKTDSGCKLGHAGTVQNDGDGDFGFLRSPANRGTSHGREPLP
jgi:hypothetical protein